MTRYWFKPKRYGYGATPATWQGWAVTAAGLVVVLGTSLLVPIFAAESSWAWFALFTIDAVTIAALWIVSRIKTQGAWRWRWGGADPHKEDSES